MFEVGDKVTVRYNGSINNREWQGEVVRVSSKTARVRTTDGKFYTFAQDGWEWGIRYVGHVASKVAQ